MGSAGAGDERECCRRVRERDARPLIVGGGVVERTRERATVGVGQRRVVQPIDTSQRGADDRERPLTFR
jgi:hypothetical protein